MSCEELEELAEEAGEYADELYDEIMELQDELDELEEQWFDYCDQGVELWDDRAIELFEKYDSVKQLHDSKLPEFDAAIDAANQADADLMYCRFECKMNGIND